MRHKMAKNKNHTFINFQQENINLLEYMSTEVRLVWVSIENLLVN